MINSNILKWTLGWPHMHSKHHVILDYFTCQQESAGIGRISGSISWMGPISEKLYHKVAWHWTNSGTTYEAIHLSVDGATCDFSWVVVYQCRLSKWFHPRLTCLLIWKQYVLFLCICQIRTIICILLNGWLSKNAQKKNVSKASK